MSIQRRSFLKSASLAGAAVTLPAFRYARVLGSNARLASPASELAEKAGAT